MSYNYNKDSVILIRYSTNNKFEKVGWSIKDRYLAYPIEIEKINLIHKELLIITLPIYGT